MKGGHFVTVHLPTLHNQNRKRALGLYVFGSVIALS